MNSLLKSMCAGLVLQCALLPLAHADTLAVLVGVTNYPALGQQYQLQGPRNDVQRMQRILQQRGITGEKMVVLADGVPGAAAPTRANILQALEKTVSKAHSGDTVLLYFAGHGSQQPADPKTPAGRAEPDGLHEILLPTDVGPWDGKAGSVKNAIINYELREIVDRMQDRGVFVWGVFDACHSASLVRGASDSEIRYRHIAPEALGIPRDALDAAEANGNRTRGGKAPDTMPPLGQVQTGGSAGQKPAVFFYAAQTTEQTPEMRFPLDDPQRQAYGLFSYMITRALELGQPMSYRQLGQYVLAQYGGISEATVTPIFTGSALDQAVLGQQTLPMRQWPVETKQLSVSAGSLSGIGESAIFALVASPLAKADDAIAYLKAVRVEGTRTELEPFAYGGKPSPGKDAFKPGTYARLVSNPENYALRVEIDARDCSKACAWAPIIEQLKKGGVPGADVRWVAEGADVILKLSPTRVVALTPTQRGEVGCAAGQTCSPLGTTLSRLASASDTGAPANNLQEINSALHAIARSRNLLRLASNLVAKTGGGGLSITLQRQPHNTTDRQPILPEQVPTLRPGDKVFATLTNTGNKPLDVTLLYADAKFGVGSLFPQQGESNRLAPGDRQVIDFDIGDEGGVLGIERLLAISVEAEKHGERNDFSFLSQPALAERGTRTRGGSSEDMQAFLDAGFADYRTRGASRAIPSAKTGMQVFTFDVKPVDRVGR